MRTLGYPPSKYEFKIYPAGSRSPYTSLNCNKGAPAGLPPHGVHP